MKHPDIELLRAKLVLMSPDDCPPAVVIATHKRFPNALKMLWVAPLVTPNAGQKSSKSSSERPAVFGIHRRARSNAITSRPASVLEVDPKDPRSSSEKRATVGTHHRARSNAITTRPAPALDVAALTDHGIIDLVDCAPAAKNHVGTAIENTRLKQHNFAQNSMNTGIIGFNDAAQRNAMGLVRGKKVAMSFEPDDVSRNYIGRQHRNNLTQSAASGPFNCANANVAEAGNVNPEAHSVVFQNLEAPSYGRNTVEGVNVPALLSSKYVEPYTHTPYQLNVDSSRVGPAENDNKRICKDTINEHGGVVTKTFIPKISAKNYDISSDKVANKSSHEHAIKKDGKSGLSGLGDAKRGKDAREPDVIIISDEDNYLDVEGIGTDDSTYDELPNFKPRYIVVDAVGWTFREVTSLKKAVGACCQVMPSIDAGNGVRLFVNDAAHACVLHNLRTEPRGIDRRMQLTGSSHSTLLMRTERKLTKAWLFKEQGWIVDPADKMLDFSPLWYLLKTKVAELKKSEEEMRRAGGGVNGGEDGRGGESAAAFSNAGIPAAGVGGGGRKKHKKRCSESDMAWLHFEDDE